MSGWLRVCIVCTYEHGAIRYIMNLQRFVILLVNYGWYVFLHYDKQWFVDIMYIHPRLVIRTAFLSSTTNSFAPSLPLSLSLLPFDSICMCHSSLSIPRAITSLQSDHFAHELFDSWMCLDIYIVHTIHTCMVFDLARLSLVWFGYVSYGFH